MSVHDDTLQGLKEALEYVKGDKSKGRSMIVEIPDNEIEADQLFFQNFLKLSDSKKEHARRYVDELLRA